MKAVIFDPRAEAEVGEAVAHYDGERPGLGDEFGQALDHSLKRIVEDPELFAKEWGEFRGCSLKRFPYVVYFVDLGDQIWIAAVAHQSRLPGYWGNRRRPG